MSEQPRDGWGRPLIVPEDGGKAKPYTRVSTLSKALSDSTGLTKWKMRMMLRGAARRPDLLALVLAAAGAGDDKRLDHLAQQLLDAAGSDSKANIGTAIHQFCEAYDRGLTPITPPEYKPVLEAYKRATDGFAWLGIEKFVVVDELQTAGTPDRVVKMPDGRILVADIKTGAREPKYPLPTSIQIACYAHGTVYQHTRDNPRLGQLADFGVSLTTGLMIHLPADGSGCDLYEVDLTAGWLAAQRAVWVRGVNKDRRIIKPAKVGVLS
jgi:hypothetical protein